MWFAAEAKESVGAEEGEEISSEVNNSTPVDKAAATPAAELRCSKEEDSDSRLRREEDLELTRRAIMDFVKLGGGDGEEDAFVLSKKGNVEYHEKIENRSRRRMGLRERLTAMENTIADKRAPVAAPFPSTEDAGEGILGVEPKNREGRTATERREIVLKY